VSSLPDEVTTTSRPHPRPVPLGRLLVERGLLTEQELIQALLEQNRTGERIGKVLIRLGYVDEPTVAMALATQHGGPLKTEYGFATGFESEPPVEPVNDATLTAVPDEDEPVTDVVADVPEQDEPVSDAAPADSPDHPEQDAASPEQSSASVAPPVGTSVDHVETAPSETAPGQIAATITALQAVQSDIDTAHARIAGLEQELGTAHARIPDLEQKLGTAHSRIADLEQELDGTRTHITGLKGELEAANSRIAELEQEHTAARGELDEQRSRAADLEEKVASGRAAAETALAALQGITNGS
jgi:hypothetical protein